MLRRGRAGGLLLAACLLVGCGTSSSHPTRTISLTPTQYDAEQQIAAFVKVVAQIEAPFTHPPTEPSNYTKANALLSKALREMESLRPPQQFRAFQDKYEKGIRGELASMPLFIRGEQTHDAITTYRAETRDQAAEHVVREALAEARAILAHCEASHFSCK